MVNNLVVCGGTFDHFHKGHEAFLKYVFSVGKKSIIVIDIYWPPDANTIYLRFKLMQEQTNDIAIKKSSV